MLSYFGSVRDYLANLIIGNPLKKYQIVAEEDL